MLTFLLILHSTAAAGSHHQQQQTGSRDQTSKSRDQTSRSRDQTSRSRDHYQHDICSSPISPRRTATEHHTSLGLTEPLCYKLSVLLGEKRLGIDLTTLVHFHYTIELERVWEVYPVTGRYSFKTPDVTATCWCDCPGGRDYCNSAVPPDQGNIVRYFSTGHGTEGCSVTMGTSQLCCDVTMTTSPGSNHGNLTAIELGIPRKVGRLRQRFVNNSSKEVVHSSLLEVDLGNAVLIDGRFQVSLLSTADDHTQMISSHQWYLVRDGAVVGGVPVNALHEWNPRKMGWYREGGIYNPALVHSLIRATVNNCGDQDIEFELEGVGGYHGNDPSYHGNDPSDNVITTDWDGGGEVWVERSTFPRLDLSISFGEDLDQITVIHGESTLGSFLVLLERDHTTNRLLLTIRFSVTEGRGGARGSIKGEFDGGYNSTTEVFYLFIKPQKREDNDRENTADSKVWLKSDCVPGTMTDICLKPYRSSHQGSEWRCQTERCPKHLPNTGDDSWPEVEGLREWDGVELPPWTGLVNPAEWCNGIDSQLEFVVMVTTLVTMVIVISCAVKIAKKVF
eukprot:sb/3463512/